MPLDNDAAHLAFRNRLLSIVMATTGSVTLTATTTGYSRASGSFVTDGLRIGMEITPAGFASNPVDIITALSALSITTKNAHSAQSSGAGRSLSALLPAGRSWDNTEFDPTIGRPWIREEYIPATTEQITTQSSGGIQDARGQYIITLFMPSGAGSYAHRRCADAIVNRFPAGLGLSDGSNVITVQGKPNSTIARQILKHPDHAGWSYCAIEIPWRANPRTAVAA